MTATQVGMGIDLVAEEPSFEVVTVPAPASVPAPEETVSPFHRTEDPNILDHPAVKDLMATMRMEFAAAVSDVERRLGQAREMEVAAQTGVPRTTAHAEDLNISKPLIDGYLATANSPRTGSFSWSDLHIVLAGVDYTIANGNMNDGSTANNFKYAWFVKPASYTPGTSADVVLNRGNNIPVLSSSDALVFVNDEGRPVSVLESTIPYAVGPGVINNTMLAQDVKLTLQNLQQADVALQGALDGQIKSYYQDDPPWGSVIVNGASQGPGTAAPSGSTSNNEQGDIWYDSNDGGAYRWTGGAPASGPANTWQRIADTSVAEVRALAGKKITTYIGSSAPVAPAEGFTVGDMWLDSANGNVLKRWQPNPTTPAWVALQLGDGAISGISGPKVGPGIIGANLNAGSVGNTQLGTGISGAKLALGTTPAGALIPNSIGNTQMAVGAIQPKNINANVHMLY